MFLLYSSTCSCPRDKCHKITSIDTGWDTKIRNLLFGLFWLTKFRIFRNIGADFQNLLKSKQAEQKIPDFGIPPSVDPILWHFQIIHKNKLQTSMETFGHIFWWVIDGGSLTWVRQCVFAVMNLNSGTLSHNGPDHLPWGTAFQETTQQDQDSLIPMWALVFSIRR